MYNLLLISFFLTIALSFSVADVYNYDPDVLKTRKTDYPIHPLIQQRTSPREMTNEDISDDDLFTLFEAARWAPSAVNIQPWRFVYAKRNSTYFNTFLGILLAENQEWAKNSSALVAVISAQFETYKNVTYRDPFNTFDTGAAVYALSLEGAGRGLDVHCIGGFDVDKSYTTLKVDKTKYIVEVFLAIGKRPPVGKRTLALNPVSLRNSQKTFVFDQVFPGNAEE